MLNWDGNGTTLIKYDEQVEKKEKKIGGLQ